MQCLKTMLVVCKLVVTVHCLLVGQRGKGKPRTEGGLILWCYPTLQMNLMQRGQVGDAEICADITTFMIDMVS